MQLAQISVIGGQIESLNYIPLRGRFLSRQQASSPMKKSITKQNREHRLNRRELLGGALASASVILVLRPFFVARTSIAS